MKNSISPKNHLRPIFSSDNSYYSTLVAKEATGMQRKTSNMHPGDQTLMNY